MDDNTNNRSELEARRPIIATRLRAAREQAGLSQGQVAKMLNLHRPSISEVEAGRRRVSAEELAQLAKIYGVDAAWLAGSDASETEADIRVELAARELSKLTPADLKRLISLLSTLHTSQGEDDGIQL
jgi:transcriptional regulator with XRE-family HTH domain